MSLAEAKIFASSPVFFCSLKCYIISMLRKEDIKKLATLARISLSEVEEEKLPSEVDNILVYVAQLKEVVSNLSDEKKAGEHRNVVRDDINPTETSINTKYIIANMPDSQDNYLKVEKIL